MTLSRPAAWSACVTAIALSSWAAAASAQARQPTRAGSPASPPGAGALIDSAHPIMQVEEVAVKGDTAVFGDASKAGMYVMRKKMAANQTARPHYDDQDRWITVLQGTLWLGKGDVYRPDTLVPIRQG